MATSWTLPLRSRKAFCPSFVCNSTSSQIRHASGPSTPRRARKAYNIAPAPHAGGSSITAGGTSGRSHQPLAQSPFESSLLQQESRGDRIVWAPPPSAPNVLHTPAKFLPRDDPRRAALDRLSALQSQRSGGVTGNGGEQLPAPISRSRYQKLTAATLEAAPQTHHLSPTAIAEMRSLRQQDESHWTRSRLASKFNCSPVFVGLVVQASPERGRQLERETDAIRARWGRKRRVARQEREQRREQWGRDE